MPLAIAPFKGGRIAQTANEQIANVTHIDFFPIISPQDDSIESSCAALLAYISANGDIQPMKNRFSTCRGLLVVGGKSLHTFQKKRFVFPRTFSLKLFWLFLRI